MNKIPKSLTDAIPKFTKGKTYVFQVSQIRTDKKTGKRIVPNSSGVPSTDRVIDPKTGEQIDISYIVRERPGAVNEDRSSYIELGKIKFIRALAGKIILNGDDAKDKKLYEYLSLCNWNKSNRGKPYHIPPYRYIFGELNPHKQAEDKRLYKRQIREAEEVIDAMTLRKLQQMCKGLALPASTNEDLMAISLMKFAEKDPQKFLLLKDDYEVKYKADIQEAVDHAIIATNDKHWVWADSNLRICSIPNGVNASQALYEFFMIPKGEDVYKRLIELIELTEIPTEEVQ